MKLILASIALALSLSTASFAGNRVAGYDPTEISPNTLFSSAVRSQVLSRVCPSSPMSNHESLLPLRDLYGEGNVGWNHLKRDFGEISDPDMLAADVNLMRASLFSGRPVEELVIEATLLTDLIVAEYEAKLDLKAMMTLCSSPGYNLEPFASVALPKAPIAGVKEILESLKFVAAKTSDAFRAKDKCGLSDDVMFATELLIESNIAWSNKVTMRGKYGIELWSSDDQEKAMMRRFNTTELPSLCERHVAALSDAESNPRLIHRKE